MPGEVDRLLNQYNMCCPMKCNSSNVVINTWSVNTVNYIPGYLSSSACCVPPTLITSGELEGEYSQESLRKFPKNSTVHNVAAYHPVRYQHACIYSEPL